MQPVLLGHFSDLASKQRCQSPDVLKLTFYHFVAKNYLSPYTYVCIVHKRYLAKHAVKVAYRHYPNFFAVVMNLDKGGVPKARGQYPTIFILTETARSIKNLLNGLNEIIPCGTKRVNLGGQDRSVLLVGVTSLIVIINN